MVHKNLEVSGQADILAVDTWVALKQICLQEIFDRLAVFAVNSTVDSLDDRSIVVDDFHEYIEDDEEASDNYQAIFAFDLAAHNYMPEVRNVGDHMVLEFSHDMDRVIYFMAGMDYMGP